MTATAEPPATQVEAPAQGALDLGQGVELLGEVHGSGYKEGAALVRRGDGQMVQLGPLMYGLLEAVDGQRDAAEVAVVLAVRMGWELIFSPLSRFLPGRHSAYVRNPWRQRIVIGWSGMRGAISLAIALTIPAMDRGHRLTEQPTLV